MNGPAIVGMVLAALLGDAGLGLGGAPTLRRFDPALESPLQIAWTLAHRSRIVPGTDTARGARAALERLATLLLDVEGLALEESIGTTPTATGAFLTRRANCLALAHLAVTVGRRAGLELAYVEVIDRPPVDHDSGLRVVHRHAAAALVDDRGALILDFAGVSRHGHDTIRVLTDHQARGLFFANRGAEMLIDGRAESALPWLEAAVELVEEDWLWRNLALALVRAGRPAAAAVARQHARDLAGGAH